MKVESKNYGQTDCECKHCQQKDEVIAELRLCLVRVVAFESKLRFAKANENKELKEKILNLEADLDSWEHGIFLER